MLDALDAHRSCQSLNRFLLPVLSALFNFLSCIAYVVRSLSCCLKVGDYHRHRSLVVVILVVQMFLFCPVLSSIFNGDVHKRNANTAATKVNKCFV